MAVTSAHLGFWSNAWAELVGTATHFGADCGRGTDFFGSPSLSAAMRPQTPPETAPGEAEGDQ